VQACGAGALQAIVAALGAHPAEFQVQITGCHALLKLVDAHPRLQAAAGAAGAVEAIVAAIRLPAADSALHRISCGALFRVVKGHRGNVAPGVIEALAAAMGSSWLHENSDARFSLYHFSVRILDALLDGGNDDAALRIIHAGLLDIVAREGARGDDAVVLTAHGRLLAMLQTAAQRHDAAMCAHDGCKRCAAARDAGRMCALAGCCARKRADDSGKRLLRCGACRLAAYCGPAHQRADYARHKTECAALSAAAGPAVSNER
jgi:hypothetical protein